MKMETRIAASAIFSRIFACGSDNIKILSQTTDGEETHITVGNYDGKLKVSINQDKVFPHIY